MQGIAKTAGDGAKGVKAYYNAAAELGFPTRSFSKQHGLALLRAEAGDGHGAAEVVNEPR